MKKLIFLVLAFAAMGCRAYDRQYRVDFNYQRVNGGQVLEEIVFTDSLEGTVVKRIHVADFSPFRAFHGVTGDSLQETLPAGLLDVSSARVLDLLPASFLERNKLGDPGRIRLTTASCEAGAVRNGDVVSLIYPLMLFNEAGGFLAIASRVYLFSSDGRELDSITDSDVMIQSVSLSGQGDYLAHTFGICPEGVELPCSFEGVRVISLKEQKKYVEFPAWQAFPSFVAPDQLVITADKDDQRPGEGKTVRLVKLKENLMFTREYDRSRWEQVDRVDATGVVFRDGNQDKWEDFSREDLSWNVWGSPVKQP